MRAHRFVLVFFFLAAATTHSAAEESEDKTAPLFASNDLLEVTIRAPIREIMRARSTEEDTPGTISYEDPEAGTVTIDLGIRTRGKYRHQKDVCPFAPLRLNFKKPKGTVFAKSDKLKLVTHCRNVVERYQQSLLREFLAYRIFNTVTDTSFRVRLLRVRYVDSTTDEHFETNYAFLIEHRDQLGKRIGMKYNPAEKTTVRALEPQYMNLGSVYQYLVGNTDFSPIKGARGEACCHNYILFGDEPGSILAVPYDFDMTGIVNASYASPNPTFRLRNVRQRLYRGRCANNEHLPRSLQVFQEKRQAIFGLLAELPEFSDSSMKRATNYIEDFYEILDSPKLVDRRLTRECI